MKQISVLKRKIECCEPAGSSTELRYPGLDEGARLLKALADETRLAIVRQLAEQGEVCACNFQACYDLAQPTVSHHLKVLREVGLVNAEKKGLWVHYTLNREKLEAARAWLP
ncbi:MAG TPA: metalloregulator ArsR/SmtB family transcription factor [Chloroflexota bacterium]